ncbi:hypothetical protein [Georgenia deserti]|uniref:DUF3017 domain-containing protein n=1 Tax=Georgenia deserti TaxID=2093781 RepID=A0ABW4L2R2_9MICO
MSRETSQATRAASGRVEVSLGQTLVLLAGAAFGGFCLGFLVPGGGAPKWLLTVAIIGGLLMQLARTGLLVVPATRERTSRVGAVLLGIGLAGGLLTLLAERL